MKVSFESELPVCAEAVRTMSNFILEHGNYQFEAFTTTACLRVWRHALPIGTRILVSDSSLDFIISITFDGCGMYEAPSDRFFRRDSPQDSGKMNVVSIVP